MAQGWSWLAESVKIHRNGPSVAMVTELLRPSGSVRVSHNELQLPGGGTQVPLYCKVASLLSPVTLLYSEFLGQCTQ